jgi:YegS/Rv2252/BmrU family lipid kinase
VALGNGEAFLSEKNQHQMSELKSVLIANPKTGRYKSLRSSVDAISETLRSQGLEIDLVYTTGPGDAARIAAKAAQSNAHQVIVLGGDGTINEAVQGLVGTETRLAILPRGTGNVLARELGLPLDLREAVNVITKGVTRSVHVGVAIDEIKNTRRYFVLMAGIGLDAAVVDQVNPRLKRRLGRGAFWLTGFGQLANWHPVVFELKVNGQTYAATFVNIGNAPRYGGDLAITPGASLDQPEFEICIIQTRSRIRYLRLLSSAMRKDGIKKGRAGVCFARATHASATGNVPVQVDGEVIGSLPMRFEIAPDTIEIVVP